MLGFRANCILDCQAAWDLSTENCPDFTYDIYSSFRLVSHRLTNYVNSTISGQYVEFIEFSVLHIKAIKFCYHLKLIM